MKSVLVVDDEPLVLEIFEGIVGRGKGDIKIECCSSCDEALKMALNSDFDAIVSDYSMPDMTGTEFLKKIRSFGKETPFILFSGMCSSKAAVDAVNEGVDYFLIKNKNFPEQIRKLDEIITIAARHRKEKNAECPENTKYKSLIESMDDSIYLVDRRGRYLFMNRKHLERLGKAGEIYKDRRYSDFHSPEETSHFEKEISDVLLTGEEREEVYEKCGRKYRRQINPVKSIDNGETIAFNVVSTEITESGNDDGEEENSIYIVDRDCRYISINPGHMKRLGICSENAFLGKNYSDFHPEGKNREFSRIINSVFESGEIIKDEYSCNGCYFTRRFCPVKDIHAGKVQAVTIVSTNVTDQKIVEKSLIEANKKINLLNSITRHDILNQMTVLQGYLELSLDGCTDESLKTFLEKQKVAADTIYSQIVFTRDYQDVGVKSPVWQGVGELIGKAVQGLDMKGIMVEDRCKTLKIFADPLMEKVFYNLIDNSLKYGQKETKIVFYYEKTPHGIKLVCEDDGVGISNDEKQAIFRQGYGKNTGLGLFLIKEILSITGLEITETGEYMKGAKFEISVPQTMFSE
ncbi:PAS domain S-box-containing protein [Methanomicrobium sp. W14]|uniref:response regulator n=1 Tax=Methanomicrobium sp. W14 TaxID=2817839 RepID=UPI001AE1905F|nr:response regulator [Methanomicrobium sp. W14]MBP2134476.1 PAS domain S-box-containing protein [Methanomicrobium sp. W14]